VVSSGNAQFNTSRPEGIQLIDELISNILSFREKHIVGNRIQQCVGRSKENAALSADEPAWNTRHTRTRNFDVSTEHVHYFLKAFDSESSGEFCKTLPIQSSERTAPGIASLDRNTSHRILAL
jgi:hypothetical protein